MKNIDIRPKNPYRSSPTKHRHRSKNALSVELYKT